MNLVGRRVIITGASRGLGAAMARSFAKAGATVVLVARSKDAISELAEELGGEAYAADLTDLATLPGLVDQIQTAGPIDVLVNNAGIDQTEWLVTADPEDLQQLLTLNLIVPVTLTRLVLPCMLKNEGGGHIVNISSMAASTVLPGLATYASSKAGLSHFTAGIRVELDGLPIGTTLVELGFVANEMAENVQSYAPNGRAARRFKRLGILPKDLDTELVVSRIVSAVEKDRKHLRMPARAALFPILNEIPRRTTELLLKGLKNQPEFQGETK